MFKQNRRVKKEKREKKISKIRVINILAIITLVVALIAIIKFNYFTKSEKVNTIPITFKEFGTENSAKTDIEIFYDNSGNNYIYLPEKINGFYTKKFISKEVAPNSVVDSKPASNIVNAVDNTTVQSEDLNNTQNTANMIQANVNDNTQQNIDNSNNNENVLNNTTNTLNDTVNTNSVASNEPPKVDENNSNNNVVDDENIKKDIKIEYKNKEYLPKSKILLLDEDIKNDNVIIEVEYDKKNVNNVNLYKQELSKIINDTEILATGYIPLGFNLDIKHISNEEIANTVSDVPEFKDHDVVMSYDIKIMNEDKTISYQPKDYFETVTVEFKSALNLSDTQLDNELKMVHINDKDKNNINLEKIKLESKEDNSIKFITDEFSVFTLLSNKLTRDASNVFVVDTREQDRTFLNGKNYYDGDERYDTNKYTDANINDVEIQYFGYDFENKSSNFQAKVKNTYSNGGTVYDPDGDKYYYERIFNLEVKNPGGTLDTTSPWHLDIYLNNKRLVNSFSLEHSQNSPRNNGVNISFNKISDTNAVVSVSFKDNILNDMSGRESYSLDLYLFFRDFSGNIDSNWYDISLISEKSKTGFVSATERYDQVNYIKSLKEDENNNIVIELIDNPFCSRPYGCGFNGWLTHMADAKIITDRKTYEQTLIIPKDKLTADENGKRTITVYPDWKPARWIEYNGSLSSNIFDNTPLPANQNASTREFNILIVGNNQSVDFNKIINLQSAVTVTAEKDDEEYSGEIVIDSAGNLYHDLQIEHIYINSNSSIYDIEYNDHSKSLNAGLHNLRIGRGVEVDKDKVLFERIVGVRDLDNNPNNLVKSRLVFESGQYYQIIGLNDISITENAKVSSKIIVGNDIDRIKPIEESPDTNKPNHLLRIFFRISARTKHLGAYPYNDNEPMYNGERYNGSSYMLIVKSGEIGVGHFDKYIKHNSNGSYNEVPYCGIYVGTVEVGDHNYGDYSDRIVIVEGGKVSNINGGLGVANRDIAETKIFVKDGEIYNIVGGAGRSPTSGNRYIHVTGGKVLNSISGGSNGYLSSSNEGNIAGKSYIYIGGKAIVGDKDKGQNTLYGVKNGSIVGAGNGNLNAYRANTYSDSSGCGNVKESNIIINEEALINGNIYGAGNYGTVYGGKKSEFMVPSIDKDDLTRFSYIISNARLNFDHTLSNRNNILTHESIKVYQPKDAPSNYSVGFESTYVRVGQKKDWYDYGDYYIEQFYITIGGKYLKYEVQNNITKLVDNKENASTFKIKILNNNSLEIFANYKADYRRRKEENVSYDYLVYDSSSSRIIKKSNQEGNSGFWLYDKNVLLPTSDGNKNYITNITIMNGEIRGDVYGGGFSNGVNGDVKIQMDNGIVYGTIYGGTVDHGRIEKSANIIINGGKLLNNTKVVQEVNKIYGGGKGTDTTIVKGNTIKISDTLNPIEIYGNIFGGSENGTVGRNNSENSSVIEITESENVEQNILIDGNVYGGGRGNANNAQNIYSNGNVEISINGANFDKIDVYGSYNLGGTVNGNIVINVGDKFKTKLNNIYACGNAAELKAGNKGTETADIIVNKDSIVSNIFGGGNEAGSKRVSNITVKGGIVGVIYGGSNTRGNVNKTNILLERNAIATNVYGGGLGKDTIMDNGSFVKVDVSTVEESIYGGGKEGSVRGDRTIQDLAKIELMKAKVKNIYGAGLGENSLVTGNVYITSMFSEIGNVYGGGQAGKVDGSTTVNLEQTSVQHVFGGGYGQTATISQDTRVTITETPSTLEVIEVYGGGDNGEVGGNTNISISNVKIKENIYGGGNKADVKGNTNIEIRNNTIVKNLYGGGNNGNVIGTAKISANASVVESLYGGGKAADVGNTDLKINNHSNVTRLFGGGDQGNVTNNVSVEINSSNILENLFGAGSGSDVVLGNQGCVNGSTIVKVLGKSVINENVFGAGKGASTVVGNNTKVIIENSDVLKNCYGGGDNGVVEKSTLVHLKGANIKENAFAAGNGELAVVKETSHIISQGYQNGNDLINTEVKKSIFGGGNASPTGIENSNTAKGIVDITGAIVGENVYGGANSSVIYGSTYVNIGIDAIIEANLDPKNKEVNKYVKTPIIINGTVYGGGESMDPNSDDFNYDTVSVTKDLYIRIDEKSHKNSGEITIKGNIFGSGNASRAEGHREIDIRNMGQVATKDNNYTEKIKDLVSIQRAVTVRVDNSNIALKGTKDSTSKFNEFDYTLNRIDNFVLKNNSTLYLEAGSNLLCSYRSAQGPDKNSPDLSKPLDDLAEVAIDNSIVTEKHGKLPNSQQKMIGDKIYSKISDQVLYYVKEGKLYDSNNAIVDKVLRYETNSVIPTTDNRIYMLSGKNLNVATTENIISYGEVKGMTFFGIYRPYNGDLKYKGMYSQNYKVNNAINFEDRDYLRAYVLGLHASNHDITKDGFYTNFEKLDESLLKPDIKVTEDNYKAQSYTNFIKPTPDNDAYYMWFAGPDDEVYNYEVKLTASKFSTYGTFDLKLLKISYPNTVLKMNKVENYLKDDVKIIDKNLIPHINENEDKANKEFGLEMRTSNSAWAMNGSTDIFAETKGQATYSGTEEYRTENSSSTPVLSFYLQNSNNISEINPDLGSVKIFMDMSYWKDPLSQGFAKVIIDVKIGTQVYDEHGYNGSITPGVYYDLFTTYPTDITTKSSFSTYFELSEENFWSSQIIKDCYPESYRAIETDFILPEGTTITMIDKSLGNKLTYYYYDVTASDQKSKKQKFRLSDFIAMGSTNEKYNELVERDKYYNPGLDYEYECFIFIFNFENAKFKAPLDPATGLMTKKSQIKLSLYGNLKKDPNLPGTEQMIYTLLSAQREKMNYSIYDVDSTIHIKPELSSNKIYLGNSVNLNVETSYRQLEVAGVAVQDTNYFDKKLGLKISFVNEKGEALKGAELIGTILRYNNEDYFPRADGTVRIKVADKVSNSSADIEIDTASSALESGKYKVKIESFGSADGIYYGINPSDSKLVPLELVNDIYGMKTTIPEEQAVIDYVTGNTLEKGTGYISKDNNKLNVNLEYVSGLTSPILTVSMERRNYDTVNIYDTNYTKVDLQDYVTNTLTLYDRDRIPLEYTFKTPDEINAIVTDKTVPINFKLDLELKQQLKTGTYRLKFRLLDRNEVKKLRPVEQPDGSIKYEEYFETVYQEIGDSFVYIVIK